MTDKITPEAIALKRRGRRRLIGGATIALLMVVFLPMVFDSEPKSDKQEISVVVPAREGLPPLAAPAAAPNAVPAAVPPKVETPGELKDVPPTTPAEVAKVAPVTNTQVAKVEVNPEVKPATAAQATLTPKADSKPATPAKKEGFALQLGVFTDRENLKQLKTKMAAAKIPIYTEELKTASGNLTRLRAGPYKTREQAEKVLLRAKKAGVDEAKVVPLP